MKLFLSIQNHNKNNFSAAGPPTLPGYISIPGVFPDVRDRNIYTLIHTTTPLPPTAVDVPVQQRHCK